MLRMFADNLYGLVQDNFSYVSEGILSSLQCVIMRAMNLKVQDVFNQPTETVRIINFVVH